MSVCAEGGIGIGGLLFWGFIMFNLFSDDDDDSDTKARVTDTKQDNEVVEQVKKSYDNLKPEVTALIDKAKDELEKVTSTDQKTTVAKNKQSDNSDPYKQDDDRYGSIDDKW